MNRTRVIYLIVFAALFGIALFVMSSANATANLPAEEGETRAEQASIQRWAAMGEFYSKQSGSLDYSDLEQIREIDAARWQALGEVYAGINLRARQAEVARWQAYDEYLSKQSNDLANTGLEQIREIDAARWQALGDTYAGNDLRARQADVARWQALGQYYANTNK